MPFYLQRGMLLFKTYMLNSEILLTILSTKPLCVPQWNWDWGHLFCPTVGQKSVLQLDKNLRCPTVGQNEDVTHSCSGTEKRPTVGQKSIPRKYAVLHYLSTATNLLRLQVVIDRYVSR